MSNLPDEINPAEAAVHFEGVVTFKKQDSKGYHLHLVIDPALVPEAIMRAWVGTRYMVAMAEIGDDEKPVAPPEVIAGNKAVASAAMLVKDTDFQIFMEMKYGASAVSEAAAIQALRDHCLVVSRSEFRTSTKSRKMFEDLRDEFFAWRRHL